MKFEVVVVTKDDSGQEMQRAVIFEKHCGWMDDAVGGLGMAESKILLGSVQKHLLQTQVFGASVGHACCPISGPRAEDSGQTAGHFESLLKFDLNQNQR